jgi:hypothetical protein
LLGENEVLGKNPPSVWAIAGSSNYEVDFLKLPNTFSRTVALGLTQPLREMSTRNLPWGKEVPQRKADNHTAICELII